MFAAVQFVRHKNFKVSEDVRAQRLQRFLSLIEFDLNARKPVQQQFEKCSMQCLAQSVRLAVKFPTQSNQLGDVDQ